MDYFSFHTHSLFCDGKDSVQTLCEQAIEQGLRAIGFSSHAPLPFAVDWAMRFEELDRYVKEVATCQQRFAKDLRVYRALEADFMPLGNSVPFETWRQMAQLDYLIGAVHLVQHPQDRDKRWFLDGPPEHYGPGLQAVFKGDVVMAVGQYFKQVRQMVQTQKPDVVAHLDKVVMNNRQTYFAETEQWYQDELDESLRLIASHGCVVEVNTRGFYKGKHLDWFPAASIIAKCIEMAIPLTVSVDAHHSNELRAGFKAAVQSLRGLGCKALSVFTGDGWEQIPICDVLY